MSAPRPDGAGPRWFGVYPALVTDIVDPDGLGRIQVKLPWLGQAGADDVRAWATLLSPYADDGQGFQALPAVDTQVVVAFEAGDARRPYIVGSAWNGAEKMPDDPAKPNNKRLIKTRSGSLLEFDDSDGAAKVTLSMKSGHKMVLDDSAQQVTVSHSNGCTITFDAGGAIKVNANSSVDVTAPVMNVHAATANFDGVVNCTTLIASASVVSPSYTPGAGNIW
ncbi:MAG TPA: phage baseplate assembly protein V [Longimicrobiaceae bacterium]|nr:phage baseplate assembly protein V [Longimicrobiaceae bacterium]